MPGRAGPLPDSGVRPGRGAVRQTGKGFAANRGGSTTGGSIGSLAGGYAANQAGDLSKVC